MSVFRKITKGCVVQTFNDTGEFIEQHFIADDEVNYEKSVFSRIIARRYSDGYPINVSDMPLGGNEYQPFDMMQE